ncbi:MAG: hypothetical protein ABW196_01110 [Solirubrobacterales bacterium]
MNPDRAKDIERELELAREELHARGLELERLRSALHERDFELSSARKRLARSEQLMDGWRETADRQERELAVGEEGLVQAELRAERFEDALTSIRTSHSYKLMRILWRVRRPFSHPRAGE